MRPKTEIKIIGYLVHFSNIGLDCYFTEKQQAETYFEKSKLEHSGVSLRSLETVTTINIDDKTRPIKTFTNVNLVRRIIKV
jgi:hypothetical protein